MTDFYAGRRVLVTGAAGFVGAHLVKALLDRGADPWLFDQAFDRMYGVPVDDLPVTVGDITRLDALYLPITRADVVFHLAGYSHINASDANPAEAFRVNVAGTVAVLEACRLMGRSRPALVVASSNHVYGPPLAPSPDHWMVREGAPLAQLDLYGATKACADHLARAWAHTYDLPIVCLRHVNCYGPADPHASHLVTGAIRSLLADEPIRLRSDGSPRKGYLHVSDVVSAYLVLGERAREPEIRGQAFNAAPIPPAYAVKEVVDTLIAIAGRGTCSYEGTEQSGYHEALDATRLRQLGWSPQWSLEAGLRDTWEWYRARPEWFAPAGRVVDSSG